MNPITAICVRFLPMTSTLISSNLCSSFFPTQNHDRIRIPAASISGGVNVRARRSKILAISLDLPLLPFSISKVLVPTESKTLHLYEAKYLSLLEEIERLDVGAIVSIRGAGRVKISRFLGADPYLSGEVRLKLKHEFVITESHTQLSPNVKHQLVDELLLCLKSIEDKSNVTRLRGLC